MLALLTERLSVVGQERLKQSFTSALCFAVKGIQNISEEELGERISLIETFAETHTANFFFATLGMNKENIAIWQDCLSTGVYALGTFEQYLQTKMQPLLANPKVRIASLWQVYAKLYAEELLHLGSQTICCPQNAFNQETVYHFINHPEQIHGAELINDIPPLLEKGYIFLNNCGENQQTDWHRQTFMDSYFKALMSYQNFLPLPKIRRAFSCK